MQEYENIGVEHSIPQSFLKWAPILHAHRVEKDAKVALLQHVEDLSPHTAGTRSAVAYEGDTTSTNETQFFEKPPSDAIELRIRRIKRYAVQRVQAVRYLAGIALRRIHNRQYEREPIQKVVKNRLRLARTNRASKVDADQWLPRSEFRAVVPLI